MQPDVTPDRNAHRLKRYQCIEIELARLLGGWLPGVESWEAKRALAGHLWEDAQHSKEVRTRLWELRQPDPDRGLEPIVAAVRSLAAAQTDVEMIAGIYLVVKRELAQAYRRYVETTHRVQDAPSIAVLKRLALEEGEQVTWAEKTVAALAGTGEKARAVRRFEKYATEVLEAIGGVSGDEPEREPPAPPPGYFPLLPFPDARRDTRFKLSLEGMPKPAPEDTLGNVIWQFNNYAQEMQAAETLGSTLWETEGMPWEFYYDVARHCWDEERHSLLGETRLLELGHHPSDFPHSAANYAWRQMLDPARRYCILTEVIEAGSFAYKNQTYQEHIRNGDTASAQAVLYDIIDETMHVRWGKTWVPKLMERYGIDEGHDDFIAECRAITAANSLSVLQREAARR